jgi:hypothetical protein
MNQVKRNTLFETPYASSNDGKLPRLCQKHGPFVSQIRPSIRFGLCPIILILQGVCIVVTAWPLNDSWNAKRGVAAILPLDLKVNSRASLHRERGCWFHASLYHEQHSITGFHKVYKNSVSYVRPNEMTYLRNASQTKWKHHKRVTK